MSDVVSDVLDSNSTSRRLAPAAVGSQVLLMSGISLVTILAFNILRPRNKIVYEPKVKYHVGDKKPPRISDGAFGWLPPLLHTKEPELLDKIGLDAVAYLRFLRMLRWLFSCVALVAGGVLIPVNVVYNLKHVPSNNRDILSMLTIRDVSGNILFVHVAASWAFSFLVMAFVWYNWKQMVNLRHSWYRSPEYMQSFYARTLMVLRVPKKYQSDEGIRSILESVQVPYPATAVHVGRRVGRLPELVEYHNNSVRELEKVLVRYLKNGQIGKKRPTLTQGGFLGMGGKKVDAIDFYTNKVKRADAAIEEYRNQIDTRKPENYGFASMAAVPYAHIVAQMLRRKKPRGTIVSMAPNPKDIIWDNLNKSDATIASKKAMGWVWLSVLCFFNTIPLLIVSFLANLASLTAYVKPLESWAKSSHVSFSIVSGVLPPAVGAFFGWFLPIAMRSLSKYQGAVTRSRLDRAVVARYFAFLILSQLIIFTLISVIFNSVSQIVGQIGHKNIKDILKNLDKLPANINTTYIDQANYWLTFFPLRGFLVVFDLAQILNLVWIWIKTRLFGRTPRDIREWTQPSDFEYAISYSNILFMVAVGILFAPLAPLVVIEAAVVFWISSFVYKYQLMFVFVSKVESGGRLWNVVINRLLWTVVFMQLLMILTTGLQMGWRSFHWVATIPPIFFMFAFKIYIDRTFLKQFNWYVPSDEELRAAKVFSERHDNRGGRLEKRFGHPALHAELFTPMLHAKMMPLLRDVYSGRINDDATTSMGEYGGQKMEASIVPGGIKIAAIHQNELEYDPVLYQRDRGELDWDQRSIGSTTMLNESAIYPQKAGTPVPSSRFSGYDAYMQRGATPVQQHQSPQQGLHDFEMSRFDSRTTDHLPLLADQQGPQQGYYDQQSYGGYATSNSNLSQTTLPPQYRYDQAAPPSPGGPRYPPGVPPQQQQHPQYPPPMQQGIYGEREATVHRPQQLRGPSSYANSAVSASNSNLAGRGAHRPPQ